ncbi:ly6/PLAUR domain-containing protein 6B [Lampris incognitus]|uniref:ly6/PLAUR domain-containing protein 6B n=1 Tax=Lampris incognitus TaxID=2546036 RepID=UPI0024B51B3E|nr:ly6/PLAUR domain-containing protein 6B [Lampris incognitus]XP_056145938.1 ly6/PLAUR domain-containing protein 6B [Lampris incognitus]
MALQVTTAIHLLALLAICDVVNGDRINFYNIRPPVDATPFPNSFKCFTCERAHDNYNCNRWAEDKWCPQNTRFCMTIHHFTSHGKTKFVTKRCAAQKDCHMVGCRHHRDTSHTECVSCCEGMICNIEVPTNHTNAVFAMTQTTSSSAPYSGRTDVWLTVVTLGLNRLFLL